MKQWPYAVFGNIDLCLYRYSIAYVGIIVTIYCTYHLSKGVLFVENTIINAILRNLIYLYVISESKLRSSCNNIIWKNHKMKANSNTN